MKKPFPVAGEGLEKCLRDEIADCKVSGSSNKE
jgi:hypothetical protein